MKNKLIADAGSTKVEWVILDPESNVTSRYTSEGLNALLCAPDAIRELFSRVKRELGQEESFDEIHYYGAGCATIDICSKIQEVLTSVWQSGGVNVSSDLLGAARSLFGVERGIACILGTGSNSCLYNGREIEFNVPSLGYVLGDEGSGAALGKRLLSDAFKGHLPQAMSEKFMKKYGITLSKMLDNVYRSPAPNRYLASLVPFLGENLWNPYIYSLVLEEFSQFIKRNIAKYKGSHSLPIAFTGSIAYYFEDVLKDALERQGYKPGRITRTPMEGLILFHS